MKKIYLLSGALFSLLFCAAQNKGIAINENGSAPAATAMLDVQSTSKGVLIPRMTTAQRTAIAQPATGLLVFDTTTGSFWYYHTTGWTELGAGGNSPWTTAAGNIYNTNSGNAGIGITDPSEKLELGGNLKMNGGARLIVFETAQGGTGTPFSSLRYAPGLRFLRQNTSTQLAKMEYVDTVDATNFLRFYTGSTVSNDMVITTAHDVGIGTQQPQVKLQVNGAGEIFRLHSGTDGPLMQFSTGLNTAAAKKAFLDVSGNDFRIGTNAENDNGKFIVRVNGVNVVHVTPTSNVGIGTSTPSAKLHVLGKIFANASGEAIKLDGTNPNIGFYQNGTYHSFISQSGTNLFLGVNNGNMQLDAQQIAIGGLIPAATGYKLTVTGKAICEELKVKLSSSWPDYVFKKEYRLPSLQSVEAFIRQNHHLPNIPKAAELEKEGVEVGEMQRRMMEKIEELTLYIIDLQKQVDALKANQKKDRV